MSRTYAPRGKRPVIPSNSEVAKRVYAASAVSAAGDLFHLVREKPFDTAATIEFLRAILQKTAQNIVVVWDNASIHSSEEMRGFLENDPAAKRIWLVRFPTYCPELNPDEQVWNQIKTQSLRNTCYRTIKELRDSVDEELKNLSKNIELISQFFKHPEVAYYA